MPIDISVVVPVLDAAEYLGTCLDALSRQALEPDRYEVVVVDNGSSDGSYEIASAHPGVNVIRHAEVDPYLARNAGARTAIGEIIVFTDAHCVAEDTWLSEVGRSFSEPGVDLVVGGLGYSRDSSRLLRLYEGYHRSKMRYVFERDMQGHLSASCGNLAIRRRVFETLGGFEPLPTPGDTELVHRFRGQHAASSLRYLPEPPVRRQSVRTLRGMLSKTGKHARFNRVLIKQGSFRTLSWRDRRRIFRHCTQANGLSRLDSGLLLCALAVGVSAFEWGQLKARLSG